MDGDEERWASDIENHLGSIVSRGMVATFSLGQCILDVCRPLLDTIDFPGHHHFLIQTFVLFGVVKTWPILIDF